MAQTYTLEEASQRLGMTAEEFKRRLREDWKSVRSFRDGATLRFRAADIDDLARAVGQASDPGLQMTDGGSPLSESSEELLLVPAPDSKPGAPNQPLYLADDSDDVLALPTDGGGSGKNKPGQKKGDSDVRLDLTPAKPDAEGNQLTEELALELPPPASGVGLGKSGSGSKITSPKSSGRNRPKPITTPESPGADDGSSEFELSLDSDSDSFELQLTNDSSEEVPLGGEIPPVGAKSGINLGRPADSGVSFEKKRPADDHSDIDFELTVDDQAAAAERSLAAPPPEEGSSEFELSLDDSSGSESMNTLASSVQQGSGDIFETDFELPSVDDESGSEVVSVDSSDTDLENSDFDLAISDADAVEDEDSASQVVVLDDEGEEPPTRPSRRNRVAAEDDEAVEVLDDEPIRTVAAPPPKWGALPATFLALTFPFLVLGGLMAFELVRGMAGYQQPNAASAPLVRGVADAFGLKTGD